MASRRTRIKGIANIPSRKKNAPKDELQPEKINSETEPSCVIKDPGNNKKDNHEQTTSLSNKTASKEENVTLETTLALEINKSNENCPSTFEEISDHNSTSIVKENEPVEQSTEINLNNNENKQNTLNKDNLVNENKPIFKRKFLRPTVAVTAINRKPKQKTNSEQEHIQFPSKPAQEEFPDVSSIDKTLPTDTTNTNRTEEISSIDVEELTTKEINICNYESVTKTNSSPVVIQNDIIEYPPPPPSPSKINRSRIKAIPRLSQRKTSFSASESEDESRRHYNRIRNDSVCSVASVALESPLDYQKTQNKEINSVIQRKCNRTEQSRKMAEARREFQRRFGTNNPDKQQLKMIDLIFYNPTTNPMSEKGTTKENPVEIPSENLEETVDDPEKQSEDEENDIPVPQIKIGPSGEIILDEKSLVIESKEVKKQKQEMQKSQLVNGDFDTGYGVYKREKKSRDWTRAETLRFYKALNMMGTDFSLMCEIFPRRTRRELKIKFKKEESVNKYLIDKALMQPCNFDYQEFKQESELEEKELETLEKFKEEIKLRNKESKRDKILLTKKRKADMQARKAPEEHKTSSIENIPTTEENVTNVEDTNKNRPQKRPRLSKPKVQRKPKPLNINSILEDSDADVSDIDTQSDSEEELTLPLRPTRSGRVPKLTQKYHKVTPESIAQVHQEILHQNQKSDVVPGSVVILPEDGPEGASVYKMYMVTPDKTLEPLDVESDVVNNIVQAKQTDKDKNKPDEDMDANELLVAEENVTIPADENITSLKETELAIEMFTTV